MNILIVDDEEDLRKLIAMYLHNSGFKTFEADGYGSTLFLLESEKIDLILLDIMLPDVNGFEICKEIRKHSNIPIIFLSAKGEEWDKVKGLQLGGDDYIVKPFSPGELVARIEAVLRRVHFRTNSESLMEYGPIKLDVDQRKLSINDEHINVTYKEFELLGFLLNHPGKVFTRETLLDQVWGIDYQGGGRTVDTHIKTLRMKMGETAGSMIQTVWGCGYKLESPK